MMGLGKSGISIAFDRVSIASGQQVQIGLSDVCIACVTINLQTDLMAESKMVTLLFPLASIS